MNKWTGWLTGAALYLALQAAAAAAPALPHALARAAAVLAAGLLAVPMQDGAEPVLAHPDYPVQVVDSCSGWDFLSLLAGLLAARAVAGRRWGAAAAALPVALALAAGVNAGRLAAVSLAGRFVLPHLPAFSWPTFHTLLGVAMFLPVLFISYVVWERKVCHVGSAS